MVRAHLAICSIAVLASMTIQSCAAHRVLTSAEVVAPPRDAGKYARFATPKGQAVTAYVTRDGVTHPFDGRARLEGDTLVFRSEQRAHRMARLEAARVERVALADLQSVRSESMKVLASAALGMGVALTLIYIIALIASENGAYAFYD
jgi:hypothetical protein